MPESSATSSQTGQNDSQDDHRGNYADDANLDAVEALLSGKAGDSQDKDKKDDQQDDQGQADDGDDGSQDAGDQDKGDDDPDADDGDGDADTKGGVDYEQKIPLADGTKLSVGELKDFYQGQAVRELELQEREVALISKLEEAGAIAEALNVIPQHIRDKVLADRQETLSREHGKVMTLIPAWKDRGTYEADRVAIYEMGKEYGLEGMFEKITDARAVKFLHDVMSLRKRIKAAGQLIKQQKNDKAKPKPQPNLNRSARQADIINKAKQGSQDDKLRAVSSLLGGG